MSFKELSLLELSQGLSDKKMSSVELVSYYLERSKENSELNAWLNLNENSMDQAQVIDDRRMAKKRLGLLAGIPIGLKDLLCYKDLPTTAGSKMLEKFISPYNSTVTQNLIHEDAIVLGKCNLDEFAMGSSNETSYFGPCKNPWNQKFVPGGSSGGSAVVVAASLAAASVGTDTGGSIRQPANFCGIVGLKPTYGRVSRYGIISYASSLDQAGPMTKTIKDAALLGQIISGYDPNDSTSAHKDRPRWLENMDSNVKGKKVGFIKESTTIDRDNDVEESFQKAKKALVSRGAEIVEVSIPLILETVSIYYLIAMSEASTNLSRYDGVRLGYRSNFEIQPAQNLEEFYSRNRGESFGDEVKRRILLGTYALSSGYYEAYYNKACKVRRLLRDQFIEALNQCDVILSHVSATSAFELDSKIKDPVQMYNNDVFTASINLAGLPAVSLPTGKNKQNIPLGVQLVGRPFDEQEILNMGLALEEEVQFMSEYKNVL